MGYRGDLAMTDGCYKGKVALFAFNGDPMCFAHVLINALDMKEKNYDVRVIIEGSATKLVATLADPEKPFASLYEKVKAACLIDCVCRACSAKMGFLKSAEVQGLPICDELLGHPSIARYMDAGYTVLTF